MADKKISALPAATIPLTGTEVLPIVQSGVTDKVTVANLTAGRSVSVADLTATTGNLVIGTSGKGIDFSATSDGSGTMTSELLADYEEGTWTVQFYDATIGGTVSPTTATGYYTKTGRQVTVQVPYIGPIDTTGMTANGYLSMTLPFTPVSTSSAVGTCGLSNVNFPTGYTAMFPYVDSSQRARFMYQGDNVVFDWGLVSHLTSGASAFYRMTITYFV